MQQKNFSAAFATSSGRRTPKREEDPTSKLLVNGLSIDKAVKSAPKALSPFPVTPINPPNGAASRTPAAPKSADHGLDVKAWELRHTAQKLGGAGRIPQNADTYQALYTYRPQNPDELELRDGDIVYVVEKCDDGWFIGTSLRTGMFGTFPGNYVQLA